MLVGRFDRRHRRFEVAYVVQGIENPEHIDAGRMEEAIEPLRTARAITGYELHQEALELCESEPNFLTNILAAGLPKINAGFEAMEKSMDEVAEEESIKLHQKIGWLSLIGNIAPMLGLFGTVYGMIQAFNEITRLGAAEIVVGYRVYVNLDQDGMMTSIGGEGYLVARGADYNHDWHLRIPLPASASGSGQAAGGRVSSSPSGQTRTRRPITSDEAR